MFADRQGSVLWVADPATGDMVAGYEYDAYGQITQIAGSLVQPYGYTGREYDPESGLYYYRARNYDPANGVFVQEDPIGFLSGQLSLYSYLNGNVTKYNDPRGLDGTVNMSLFAGSAASVARTEVFLISSGLAATGGLILQQLKEIYESFDLSPEDVRSGDLVPPPFDPCGPERRREITKHYKALQRQPHSCSGLDPSDIVTRHSYAAVASELLYWRRVLTEM